MRITLLLSPQFSNHCLANTLEPLRAANDLSGQGLFEWTIASLHGAPVTSSSGLEIAVTAALSDCRGDLLIALPSYGFRELCTVKMQRGLRAAAGRFAYLGGFDTGAWLLADAGLLDGYRATLHWEELEDFAEAFPNVDAVRERHLWDRDRLSCAGAAAAFGAMSDIVENVGGAALRLEVAMLFVAPEVASDPQMPEAQSTPMARMLGLMQDQMETPPTTAHLAAMLAIPQRSLERMCQAELGASPGQIFKRLRLIRGRKLVRETRFSMAEIALRCGYQDASAFARAFREAFGHPPRDLRR